jgi:serine phosphatase RsbU (regulator of sigma subunit)
MLRNGWDNLELERITTLLVATVDARNGELRIVSAGHPPPLLVADHGATFVDVRPTTPLGAPASPIREWRGTLEQGAALLLYTDGLIEDRHRSFEAGSVQLARAVGGCSGAERLCDRVLETMVLDALHHNDDIAMVALSRSEARS